MARKGVFDVKMCYTSCVRDAGSPSFLISKQVESEDGKVEVVWHTYSLHYM